MQLLEDGIIAALASIGLVTLLFLVISALLRPRERELLDAVVIVPCSGGACARLERTIHTLTRSRFELGGFRRIVILDCGLDAESRRTAKLLCCDNYDVTLCEKASLSDELEWANGRTTDRHRNDCLGDLPE